MPVSTIHTYVQGKTYFCTRVRALGSNRDITYSSCDSEELVQEQLQQFKLELREQDEENRRALGRHTARNRLDGLSEDQLRMHKKLNSMRRSIEKQQLRFDKIYDKIKKHTQLENSK